MEASGEQFAELELGGIRGEISTHEDPFNKSGVSDNGTFHRSAFVDVDSSMHRKQAVTICFFDQNTA